MLCIAVDMEVCSCRSHSNNLPECLFHFLKGMKRVRTEQIQYAVTQYLKRRQYVDSEGNLKIAKLSQTAEEMAANLTG